MAQYRLGTCSVTNGNATVTLSGASSGAENVAVGDYFKVERDGEAIYQISARTPSSGASITSLTLSATYGGTTGSGLTYQIHQDYTANRSYPMFYRGDQGIAEWLTRALVQIDSDMATALGTVFTQGSVIFKGSGALDQDNANFFYDKTNKRWGFGTASPAVDIHIQKSAASGLTLRCKNTSTDANADSNFQFQNSGGVGLSITAKSAAAAGNFGTTGIAAANLTVMETDEHLLIGPSAAKVLYLETARAVRLAIDGTGNIGLWTSTQFGDGTKVLGIQNASVVPSSNPTGGGVLYADSGALKWRGSSGTVTTLAAA